MELPASFIDYTRALLGDEEYDKLAVALQQEPPVSIRLNQLKINHSLSDKVPWSSEGFYLEERLTFTFDPLFHAGCYYVQEAWKSKILAVDYLMLDEREKQQKDLMDYVRGILFGYSKGETLATYWKKHNTDYATVDVRFGVKATKEVAFQFMVNNLLNKEYSYRPMAVAAPRTFVLKMDVTF